jgi:hypothetical protein
MQHGTVRDEDGHEADAVLRPNGVVTFTVGRTTRHISLEDFEDLGMKWKPSGPDEAISAVRRRDPVDSPRYFRITGEGL